MRSARPAWPVQPKRSTGLSKRPRRLAAPNGCYIYISPHEPTVSKGAAEGSRAAAEEGLVRAREREAKAQAEHEAAAKASQPSAPAPSSQPIPPPSSVSLVSTGIIVQSGHVSLVQLECLGAASCNGKLTLSAKIPAKAKSGRKHAHMVALGTTDFSIPGDEARAVKLDISATGRALLSADHGRLSASLAIHELPPSPESTLTKAVQLIQQKVRVNTSTPVSCAAAAIRAAVMGTSCARYADR
jgi:hypothetical protein